jgi:hypothetical protein
MSCPVACESPRCGIGSGTGLFQSMNVVLSSQEIFRLRHSPLAEGECPKGEGLTTPPGLPKREEKDNIKHLTLPPSGTSLYQKGRELTPDEDIIFLTLVMALLLSLSLSRRDNTLLTVDVNLRTETNHTLSQVPQGRHLPIALVGAGRPCPLVSCYQSRQTHRSAPTASRKYLSGRANPAPTMFLFSSLSRRDNILLTIDVNLRIGTNHILIQVPQGRHYSERAWLHRPVRDEILVEKIIRHHPPPSRMGRNVIGRIYIPSHTGRQQWMVNIAFLPTFCP